MSALGKRIDTFPEEILLRIFSYFNPRELSLCIAPVCTNWWKISKDSSLWRSVVFNVTMEETRRACCELLARCPNLSTVGVNSTTNVDRIYWALGSLRMLVELNICNTNSVFDFKPLAIIELNCPQIQILSVAGGVIDFADAYSIVRLRKLRALELSMIYIQYDECIDIIIRECPVLEYLRFSHLLGCLVSDMSIELLSKFKCKTMKHFYFPGLEVTGGCMPFLKHCKKLVTLGVSAIDFDNTDAAYFSEFPNLRGLELSILGPGGNEPFFTNPNFPQLQIFEVIHDLLTDVDIQNVAQGCPDMRVLNLVQCARMNDDCLLAIIEHCKRLAVLILNGDCTLTEHSLAMIPPDFPSLKYLSIPNCSLPIHVHVQEVMIMKPSLKVFLGARYETNWTSKESIAFDFSTEDVIWTYCPDELYVNNKGQYRCTLQKPVTF